MGKQAGKRTAGAVLALLLASGCKSSSDYWSFSLTRSVYGDLSVPRERYVSVEQPIISGEDGVAYLALGLLVLPLAVDLVVLPVTAVHDAFVE